MGGSVSGQCEQGALMADELDLLQEQDELLNQLHIQAARQRKYDKNSI